MVEHLISNQEISVRFRVSPKISYKDVYFNGRIFALQADDLGSIPGMSKP